MFSESKDDKRSTKEDESEVSCTIWLNQKSRKIKKDFPPYMG